MHFWLIGANATLVADNWNAMLYIQATPVMRPGPIGQGSRRREFGPDTVESSRTGTAMPIGSSSCDRAPSA